MSRLFPERLSVGLSPATGGIEALRGMQIKQPCRVTVVLSNHYVRYAIVPWSGELAGEAEEQAYVRHHFVKIHGERAKSWLCRATGESARLCSAIDSALLEELKTLFSRKPKTRLVSVQPALMTAFNGWRASIPPAGAWLVLVEPERACVALHAAGRWQSVQNAKGEWRAALERERHRAAGAVPDLVLKLDELPT